MGKLDERNLNFDNSVKYGTNYSGNCSTWNVHTKKTLKWSNISVKKYQKRPMLGVSSGTDSTKP